MSRSAVEDVVASFDDIARRQRGYLDLAQAASAGLSQNQISLLVAQRHWQRPHPGVYRTGSAPPEWEDKVRAACMAAGPDSRAMGRTAARLHGLDGAETHTVVELVVPKGHGPTPRDVIVHETRRIEPVLASNLRGIPVSSINQTLLEYAWTSRSELLIERAVEDALRRGRTSEGALRRFVGSRGRGVEGVSLLRHVLDSRPAGRPARSGFEVIVLDILREYGLPLPVRRPLVRVPPDHVFELDLAYMQHKVDIEPMGEKWHSTARQVRQDAERRRVLEPLAWIIVPVWWDQAIHAPADVAARVREVLP
jgi:putative AbiEi antitoxin of type IV toxin-antitoxin system